MAKYSTKKINKKKRTVTNGIVKVCATFNNTIISITDLKGDALCWSSAGKNGFKGSRKATPYAAQVATQEALTASKAFGLQTVLVEVSGPGVGREASLRALQASDINVTSITDNTYHPHNGCRPPKRRRV
jgi:small subunit ribosomal protein S11